MKFNYSSFKSLFQRGDLTVALIATVCFGAAGGIVGAALNNYLADVHHLDAAARGWLEFPREMPGFLMMFVAGALLTLFRETQIAALAMLFTVLGAVGLGFYAPGTVLLVTWIMVYSLADHLIFAVEGPIGLKLARSGSEGRRLGQFGGARNIGTIVGVAAVFVLARFIGDRYDIFFLIAAGWAILAGVFYARLKIGHTDVRSRRMVVRKKYSLFYVISAFFGIRKQIFLVFGSWVLVSLHNVPVSTIALLYFIAAVVGIVVRPLLGDVIDWLGERVVLSVDEIFLLAICLTYAFATDLLPAPYALYALYAAYILDNILFSLRVALTTYLQKIADDPADITPTISMGITIDHSVAMSLPVFSGYIWEAWGFRWVFLIAGAFALVGFFICLRIRIPTRQTRVA